MLAPRRVIFFFLPQGHKMAAVAPDITSANKAVRGEEA